MPTADAISALTAHDVPCAPVVALDEIAAHPQVVANDAVRVVDHPVLGPIRQPVPMPQLNGMDVGTLRPAPRLGEHSAEILVETGFAPSEIDALVAAGVVGIA
jgi:crotonobetainyl-CoA:carnitine CoA-transferase CaiB-like acyl-CoA transferase